MISLSQTVDRGFRVYLGERSAQRPRAAAVLLLSIFICTQVSGAEGGGGVPEREFLRGDVNVDGRVTHSDALLLFSSLFSNGVRTCDDAADVNDDGIVNITDGTNLVRFAFIADDATPPSPPFPDPGTDPTADALDCAEPQVVPPEVVEGFSLRWDAPSTIRSGARQVEAFLNASTAEPIACLTAAFRIDRRLASLCEIDTEGTILPEELRTGFELTRLRVVVSDAFDPRFSLVRVLALYDNGTEDPIAFPATERALVDEPLLRVVFDVREDAAIGADRSIILPALPEDLPAEEPGGLNEFCTGFDAVLPESVGTLQAAIVEPPRFIRGDVNLNGQVTGVDARLMLDVLFLISGSFRCDDAADVNDDGIVNITDPVSLLSFIFLSSVPPQAPFPFPGPDPTDDDPLDCADSNIVPPVLDFDYEIAWETDPEVLQSQKNVDIYLLATTEAAIECFSIAYRFRADIVENIRVDFEDTVMPPEVRASFESSDFFTVELSPEGDLLQVGALFVDNSLVQLEFAATQRPLARERLLHIRIDIADDAPPGDNVVLFSAVEPGDLPKDNKFFNEFCRNGANAGGGGAFAAIELGAGDTERGDGGGGIEDEAQSVQPKTDNVEINIIGGGEFLRGDANGDSALDISDVLFIANALFSQGAEQPVCLDAADANGDRVLDISDPQYLANWMFLGLTMPERYSPPPPPFNVEGICELDVVFLGCETPLTSCCRCPQDALEPACQAVCAGGSN